MIVPSPLLFGSFLLQLVSTSFAAVTVSTFAGTGREGNLDGPRNTATLNSPHNVAIDNARNIYVTESFSSRIRKVTPGGTVSTFDVNWDRDAPILISGIAVNTQGDLFISIGYDNVIYQITSNGSVSVFAGGQRSGFVDGPVNIAQFKRPTGLAFDSRGNLIVADKGNYCIRKITPTGMVSTLAGNPNRGYLDEIGLAAQFNDPHGVAVDPLGNVYVADKGNNCIRKITPEGAVSTIAGSRSSFSRDGSGFQARFRGPTSIAVDTNGNVFVSDWAFDCIRKITPNGSSSTMAGDGEPGFRDGPGQRARFDTPAGIAVNSDGNLFVADTENHRIRKITFTSGEDDGAYLVYNNDQDSEIHRSPEFEDNGRHLLGDNGQHFDIYRDVEPEEDPELDNIVIESVEDFDGPVSDDSDNDEPPMDHTPAPPRPINYGEDDCAICYESKNMGDDYDYCSISCGNTFHKRCIDRCMTRRSQRKCPMCRSRWIINKPTVAIPSASPEDQ